MADRDNRFHPTSEEPTEEPLQPDPQLREGRLSRWAIWGAAVAIVVVVCIVLYGLNTPNPTPQPDSTAQTPATSSPPPASSATTGSDSK
jgi:uncharacterized protein involved in exopolysaccharide biosynthesis